MKHIGRKNDSTCGAIFKDINDERDVLVHSTTMSRNSRSKVIQQKILFNNIKNNDSIIAIDHTILLVQLFSFGRAETDLE